MVIHSPRFLTKSSPISQQYAAETLRKSKANEESEMCVQDHAFETCIRRAMRVERSRSSSSGSIIGSRSQDQKSNLFSIQLKVRLAAPDQECQIGMVHAAQPSNTKTQGIKSQERGRAMCSHEENCEPRALIARENRSSRSMDTVTYFTRNFLISRFPNTWGTPMRNREVSLKNPRRLNTTVRRTCLRC